MAVLVGLRMINKKKRQIRSRRWCVAFWPKREGAGITYSQTTYYDPNLEDIQSLDKL